MIFSCLVAFAALDDADTVTCREGYRVRLAAVSATERGGRNHVTPAPRLGYAAARTVAKAKLDGRALSCVPHRRSGKRIVASCTVNGRDVGCALIRAGAAVDWPKYRVRYGLRPC